MYETFTEVLSDIMVGQGKSLEGTNILDIGCFTGEFLELIQSRGADVFGLELQTEAVAIANAKLPGKVYKADFWK